MQTLSKDNLHMIGRCYARIARVRAARRHSIATLGWSEYRRCWQRIDRDLVRGDVKLVRDLMNHCCAVATH